MVLIILIHHGKQQMHYFFIMYFSDEAAKADLRKLPVLPTRTLKERPSISFWWVMHLETWYYNQIDNNIHLMVKCYQYLITVIPVCLSNFAVYHTLSMLYNMHVYMCMQYYDIVTCSLMDLFYFKWTLIFFSPCILHFIVIL